MLEKLNLPLFLGLDPRGDEAIAEIIEKNLDFDTALARLSYYFKIRITFSEPVEIRTVRRRKIIEQEKDPDTGRVKSRTWKFLYSNTGTVHVLHGFFNHERGLCYKVKNNSQRGYLFNYKSKIVSCEPAGRN